MARSRAITVAVVAAAGVLVVAIVAAAVLSVRVEGSSMRPTLRPGDRLLLRPFSGGHTPERFALVVARFSAGGPRVVKRVIGLPGDRVEIARGPDGAPLVEVQPAGAGPWLRVSDPAWVGQWSDLLTACCQLDGRLAAGSTPAMVPAGMLFLLGDAPAASQDSRSLGWAPAHLLAGVVQWRIYPLSELGRPGGQITLSPLS
jgi:signal peptidase I